ncbi:STAS domain-containing protein [Mucisphaera calidilacus]|uniref:Anti-sigma factor antagonist n=1 Tax=Mucisphaera calidilacus TaxID=2527982 RepID=A0A518BUL2_9BACT|nr:STAS domain-containing protein [Mucisphaera calidilacus]QDU70617.1 Putative anti-sigma factor antagonist [Mucisphaera calidilacus]
MALECELVEGVEDLTIVRLVGKLDIQGTNNINMKFHAKTAARQKPTVIDLEGVTFVSSIGIGMLVTCATSLKRKGCEVILAAAKPEIEEVFRASRLDAFFRIVDTVEEAESLLRADAA